MNVELGIGVTVVDSPSIFPSYLQGCRVLPENVNYTVRGW